MDAGNLGFSSMFERTIWKPFRHDFICYCSILHDYRFRGHLPKNQTTQSRKTIQNMALSRYTNHLFGHRNRFLCPTFDLQTAIHLARIFDCFTRASRILPHQ